MRSSLFLIGVIIVSSLDFSVCYFITHNLIGKKIKHALKAATYKDGLLACSYIVIMIFLSFAEDYFNFRYLGWFSTMIIMLVVIISVLKSRNSKHSIDEIILMFLISNMLFFLIVMPVVVLRFTFSPIPRITFLTIATTLTLGFLFVLDKIDLNKLLVFIIHRIALKIAFFILSLITLSIFVFIMMNYSIINAPQALIPLGLLSMTIIIGLIQALKAAHQYEIVVPEKYHDMKRILTLLNINAEDAQSVDELRKMIRTTIELMGIKVAKTEPKKLENEPKDFEAFIKATIDSLKLNHKSNVNINTNIQYFEPHQQVNAMNISYMLGILLENALETGTEKPIIIDILSTNHILFIKVANETEAKSSQEIQNMLSKGYSSKGRLGRGFGLPKLKKLVESHQGTITISQEMNPQVQANYIVFMLNF